MLKNPPWQMMLAQSTAYPTVTATPHHKLLPPSGLHKQQVSFTNRKVTFSLFINLN